MAFGQSVINIAQRQVVQARVKQGIDAPENKDIYAKVPLHESVRHFCIVFIKLENKI